MMTFRHTALVALALLPLAGRAFAQTDYYNTDAGRPLTVEDAYPTERHAFEWQIAPLRLERARTGAYHWGFEPEVAYGILPRTHIEVGAPLAFIDVAGTRTSGLAGLDISLLHNLNVETTGLPALGLGVQLLAPVGGLAPDKAYPSFKGIATRTFRWARFHVNGEYTIGDEPTAGGALEVSRWLAGLAMDRTYPLRSLLVGAEVSARQPIHAVEEVEWTVAGGVRKQLSPQFNLDGGIGRRLTGAEQSWFATFGLAYAFGIPGLIPVR